MPAKKMGLYKKTKSFLKKLIYIKDSPQKIARGFAIGVFWGIMPTFGFAIVFSLPTAVFLKGNKFASVVGTFVANPLTVPFFYPFEYKIGQLILGSKPLPFSWNFFSLNSLLSLGKSFLIGGVIFATGMAFLTYFLVVQIIIRYRSTHHSTNKL